MCSVEGDIEDISNCSTKLNNIIIGSLKKCKKCENKPVLLLQKKDPFCQKCFFEYCDHKFRSTIGKTKKVKHGQKVLLACSGGRKSSALLHMTIQALDSASVKQISFIPGILFINEFPNTEEIHIRNIISSFKSCNYPILFSSLEMVKNINTNEDLYSCIDPSSTDDISIPTHSEEWLKDYIEDMPLSSKLDFIKHIRIRLITEISSRAGYDYVFLGDTATSLAIDLLTGICLGRGSQISSATSFIDTRYKVPACRPLREFLNKELSLYIHLHHCSHIVLPELISKQNTKSCVQRLTEEFITNLEKDFPATVFTIFRTGGKLSEANGLHSHRNCLLCQSPLDNVQPESCSALEALKISHKLSQKPPKTLLDMHSQNIQVKSNNNLPESTDYIDVVKFLCHGCSIHYRNNKKLHMKDFYPFMDNSSLIKMERSKLKEEIEDYLIEEENE